VTDVFMKSFINALIVIPCYFALVQKQLSATVLSMFKAKPKSLQ